MAHFTMEQIFNNTLKLVETWSTRVIRVRAMKTIDWQMSVGAGKPPQKLRGAEDAVCKYYASTGQRFLLSKPVSVSVHDTRRTVSGGPRSEARAPAPPPSDKPGATPPGDAYAPLGAAAPVHRKHHRPPLGTRNTASHRHRRADQTGPRALCTAPTLNFTTASYLGALQKINNFPLLKKTRKQIAKQCRQPRYLREQWTANKRRTFLVSS